MKARVFPFSNRRKANNEEPVITISPVLRDYGLLPIELTLFTLVASFSNSELGWCTRSAKELAGICGISPRAAQYALSFLELCDLIETARPDNGKAAWRRPRPMSKWQDISCVPVFRLATYPRPKAKDAQPQAASSNVLTFPGERAGNPKRAC